MPLVPPGAVGLKFWSKPIDQIVANSGSVGGGVTTLLHFEGPNNSTSIVDSSGTGRTASVVNTAHIDTSQFQFGSSSVYFDGTSNCQVTINAPLLQNNDFTIEFWLRRNGAQGQNNVYSFQGNTAIIFVTAGNVLSYWVNNGPAITGASTVTTDVWHHVALTRQGPNHYLFLDGIKQGVTYPSSIVYSVAGSVVLGCPASGVLFNGWMDEVRITSGTALWISNFTPPASPYTDNQSLATEATDVAAVSGTVAWLGTLASTETADVFGTVLTAISPATDYHVTHSGTSPIVVSEDGTLNTQHTLIYDSGPFPAGDYRLQVLYKGSGPTPRGLNLLAYCGPSYSDQVNLGVYVNGTQRYAGPNPGGIDFTFIGASVVDNGDGYWKCWLDFTLLHNATTLEFQYDMLVDATGAFQYDGLNNGSGFSLVAPSFGSKVNGTVAWAGTLAATEGADAFGSEDYFVTKAWLLAQVTTSGTAPVVIVTENTTNNFHYLTWNGPLHYPGKFHMELLYQGSGTTPRSLFLLLYPGGANYDRLQLDYIDPSGTYFAGGFRTFRSTNQFTITGQAITDNGDGFWRLSVDFSINTAVNLVPQLFATVTAGHVQSYLGDGASGYTIKEVSFTSDNGAVYWQGAVGAQTQLLLHCDGADSSTTIIDSGAQNRPVAVVNDAKIKADQSKFGGSSVYFDGVGDYLSIPGAPVFGTSDFTIDFWVQRQGAQGQNDLFCFDNGPIIYLTGGGLLNFWQSGAIAITGSTVMTSDVWHHIALTRQGTSTRLFLDGVQQGATWQTGLDYVATIAWTIGGATTTAPLKGWIDEVRVLVGQAAWTSNFTPPTSPYGTVTDTSAIEATDTASINGAVSDEVGTLAAVEAPDFTYTDYLSTTVIWTDHQGTHSGTDPITFTESAGGTLHNTLTTFTLAAGHYRLVYESSGIGPTPRATNCLLTDLTEGNQTTVTVSDINAPATISVSSTAIAPVSIVPQYWQATDFGSGWTQVILDFDVLLSRTIDFRFRTAVNQTGVISYSGLGDGSGISVRNFNLHLENIVAWNASLGAVEVADAVSIAGTVVTTAVGACSGIGAATAVGTNIKPAVGSSAGLGTATAVGTGVKAAVGASAGIGTASAVGASTAASVGASSGLGTATTVGTGIRPAVGSSAGIGTANAVGLGSTASVGASAGTGTATAVGTGIKTAVGTSTGIGTATAVGLGSTASVGASAGLGTTTAVGASTKASVGASSGVGAATAVGLGSTASVGASSGLGTANAVGFGSTASVGTSSGSGIASAIGTGVKSAVGFAAGAGTATAVGLGSTASVGASTGIGTTTAVGLGSTASVGSSIGTGTATATGVSSTLNVGASNGIGTASAVGFGSTASVGTSSGLGAAAAVGTGIRASVGASAGTGTAAAIGISTAVSVGASSGVGTVSAVGTGVTAAVGAASGVGTAASISVVTSAAVGSSAGVGTAVAVGKSTAASVGNSAGTGTGIAFALAGLGTGVSAGAGLATGVGAVTFVAVGSASGVGVSSATGTGIKSAVGAAAGIGSAASIYAITAARVGSASGAGTASAAGTGINSATGAAAGISSAAGIYAVTTVVVGSASGVGATSAIGTGIKPAICAAAGIGTAQSIGAATSAAAGSSAGVGNASATTALGISATFAATEAPDVAAIAGRAEWFGTLAVSETIDTAAVNGLVACMGTLAAQEAADTSALVGGIYAAGALVATEAPDASAVVGGIYATATLGATEAPDGVALVGGIYATGALAGTELPDAVYFVQDQPAAVGTLAAQDATDTGSLGGTVVWVATLATIEAGDSAAVSGAVQWNAALAVTEVADTASISGQTQWVAALAANEGSDSAAISGLAGVVGAIAVTEARDAVSIGATVRWFGTLVANESSDAVGFTAGVFYDIQGSLSGQEDSDVAAISFIALAPQTLVAYEAPDSCRFTEGEIRTSNVTYMKTPKPGYIAQRVAVGIAGIRGSASSISAKRGTATMTGDNKPQTVMGSAMTKNIVATKKVQPMLAQRGKDSVTGARASASVAGKRSTATITGSQKSSPAMKAKQ